MAMKKPNATERISPLYNDVFLKVFGESEALAKGLSNAFLRFFGLPELGEVEKLVVDSSLPSAVGLKAPRCDVTIVAGEQVVNLEPQIERVNVDNKALFYGAKLLCANTPKGSDSSYRYMPQVVVIMLLKGQRRFPGGEAITLGRMAWEREDAPVAGSDRIVFMVVELDKVAKAYNEGVTEEVLKEELNAWLYVLARGYRNEEELDRIMGSFPTIAEFAEQYGLAIDDPNIRRSYEAYFESVMEYNSIIEEGIIYGLEKAVEEARQGFEQEVREKVEREVRQEVEREVRQEVEREVQEQARAEERDGLIAQFRELGISEEVINEAIRQRSATS